MAENKTGFFIIRGKINPERILLVRGKILSHKPYLDTTQYKIRILEFKHIKFQYLKRCFIGERYFSNTGQRRMFEILREARNIKQVQDMLDERFIVAYVDELYVFKTFRSLLKNLRPLQEFYVRKHLKDLAYLLGSDYYEGPFKMNKNEFYKRFEMAFKDRYKKSFNDETFDDFIKNI